VSAVNKVTLHQALRGRNLNSTQRDVLQALASYGSYELTDIRPALGTVAKDYGLNLKTVRGAVNDLQRLGYLHQVKAGAGRGNPSQYNITVPPAETLPSNGTFSLPIEAVKGTVSGSEKLPLQSTKGTVSRHKDSPQMGVNQLKTSSSPVKSTSSSGIATAIPAEFSISAEMNSWAAEHVPAVDVVKATEKFIGHAHKYRRTSKDWMAAWRKWMLDERPQQRDYDLAVREPVPAPPRGLNLHYTSEWCRTEGCNGSVPPDELDAGETYCTEHRKGGAALNNPALNTTGCPLHPTNPMPQACFTCEQQSASLRGVGQQWN
jgi:hypothetical protein